MIKSGALTFLLLLLVLVGAWLGVSPEQLPLPQAGTPSPIIQFPAFIALPVEEPALPNTASTPYIEVVDSCGPYYEGACVNLRSGPSTDAPVVAKLRKGIVLKVAERIEVDGVGWYKISLDEWLRYPERVNGYWYVAADYVERVNNAGDQALLPGITVSSTKRILVDRSEQKLYAYDGDELFMEEKISTGIALTPTPRGTFTIYKKTPSRYMQGPIPGISTKTYDLPGVPWNLYFTSDGAVIHGAYWHDHFGERWSSGCVNLPPDKAKKLYEWAEVGIKVTIRD